MNKRILKCIFLSMLTALMFCMYPLSQSDAENAPKEIIVDREGGGEFQSISEALRAITDASETNRYQVRVKPGIYTEQVMMKSHVDISGSGQDSTTIASDSDDPTVLWPVQNVSLENITITGKGRDIVLIEGSARMHNVSVVIPGSSQNGIATSKGASLEFSGSTIHADSDSGGITGISFEKGILLVDKSSIEIRSATGSPSQGIIAERAEKATIRGSLIKIEGIGYGITAKNTEIIESNISVKSPVKVINDVIGVASWDDVAIISSEVNVTAQVPSKRTVAVDVSGDNTVIRNSLVSSDFYGIRINRGMLEVNESTISGKTLGLSKYRKGIFAIRNSRIIGGHDGKKGIDSVVNCIDEKNTPLPNLQ